MMSRGRRWAVWLTFTLLPTTEAIQMQTFRSHSLEAAALAAGLALLGMISGCDEGPTLIEGTVSFSPPPATSLEGATMRLVLSQDDGTGALTPIQTVEQEMEAADAYGFTINGEEPPPGTYVLRVHVDADSDGTENAGDYVSGQTSVLQGGPYPEQITIPVTAIE